MNKKGKGRPTKYKKEYADICHKLCLAQMTDEEIAKIIGVNTATFYRWKEKYSDFCEAIKKGRDLCKGEIVASMYKVANGYDYDETKQEVTINPDGTQITKSVVTKKTVLPNVGAGAFLLKNLDPERWNDRRNVDITTGGDKVVSSPVINFTDNSEDGD